MSQAAIEDESMILDPSEAMAKASPPSGLSDDCDDDSSLVDLVKKLAGDEEDLPPSLTAAPAMRSSSSATNDGRMLVSATFPQPKINHAAMQRAKHGPLVEQAQESMQRLFGGATAVDGAETEFHETTDAVVEDAAIAAIEAVPEKKWRLPPWVSTAGDWLDRASGRLERLHPFVAPAIGLLGLFLLFQAFLVFVMAHLGWI